jgi:hypothetical protein
MNRIKRVQLYTWGFENHGGIFSRVTMTFIRQKCARCYVRRPQNTWVKKARTLSHPVRGTNELRIPGGYIEGEYL